LIYLRKWPQVLRWYMAAALVAKDLVVCAGASELVCDASDKGRQPLTQRHSGSQTGTAIGAASATAGDNTEQTPIGRFIPLYPLGW